MLIAVGFVNCEPFRSFIDKSSNGQLVLELKAGISKSDFTNAVIATIRPSSSPQTPGPDLDLNSPGTNSSTVDDLFRDRRQRLDAEKKQEHDAERAEQKAKAKARREAIEGTPGSARAKQLSYAQQQRKRQQDERLERERIRRDIENDKAARKEKEERRKANYKAETKIVDSATDLMDQPLPSNAPKPGQISSNRCALQVRLFDGSTIRKLFQPQETLRADVRAWIDEQSDHSDVPYTLKQILTPEPNRTIGISEEGESLQSLSLMPSATLVMVPVSNFTDAYSQGVLSRGVSAGYNIASQGISSIAGALYQVLGFGQPTQQAERPTSQSEIKEPEKSRTEIRVRSLRDQQHEPQDHQFYNGNQVCGYLTASVVLK